MNGKRRLWIIIGAGIVITVAVVLIALRLALVCCALPPGDYFTATAIVKLNQTAEAAQSTARVIASTNDYSQPLQMYETQTAAYATGLALTPSLLPYDATLYAQRRHEYDLLKTAGGPTEYAIFFATEMALVATYQGTPIPAQKTMTAVAGVTSTYGWASVMTQVFLSGATFVPTPTPPPYTADMSPTAIPRPTDTTRTATPTLCPPSDVICPGGNATMSAADKVMVLMASAIAPEFGQLAQTATALAVISTPSPTSSVHDSNCAFSWAHQDLPEVAESAREAFNTISSAKIQVLHVDAYGEDCNRADGSLSYFAAMTTDFYLSTNVTNLNETRQMAQAVMTAYGVLTELKLKLPAQAGYLDMVYTSSGQEKRFRAMFSQIKRLIETGKGDTELLAAGGM